MLDKIIHISASLQLGVCVGFVITTIDTSNNSMMQPYARLTIYKTMQVYIDYKMLVSYVTSYSYKIHKCMHMNIVSSVTTFAPPSSSGSVLMTGSGQVVFVHE